jgi:hypothetical protein
MVIKPAPAVFLTEELKQQLKVLPPGHKHKKWINDMELVLKGNMFAGFYVQKSEIPDYYRRRYGANHLYHYDHPEGFRSCYMLLDMGRSHGVCPLILDLKNHKEHARIFGHN